jgi:alanine-synthesizing transaminase
LSRRGTRRLRVTITPVVSRRSSFESARTRVAEAVDRARSAGAPLLDLTASNPTEAGLPYDAEAIRGALAPPEVLRYAPHPFGMPEARQAVSEYLQVSADRVVLTASTSEAYAFLLKLLCDPGDEVLVAQPSYPLLEHLARFEAVRALPYPLRYDGEWHIDLPSVRSAVSPRTRAILTVSPNNPTGSYSKQEELRELVQLGLPVIADEVFAAYPLEVGPGPVAHARDLGDTLTFTLGGLSKECGLPQVKLGWMVVGGPPAQVTEALERLELIADAFLSVSAPAQVRIADLLAAGEVTRGAIRARTRANLTALRTCFAEGSPVDVLRVEGGWYAVVRVPRTVDEEAWILALLEEGVVVHPGWFYDFPESSHLVLSLLPPEASFAEAVQRMARVVARLA